MNHHQLAFTQARDADLSNVKEDLIVMTLRAKEQATKAGMAEKEVENQRSKAAKFKDQVSVSGC
jgi:hypothetical protein